MMEDYSKYLRKNSNQREFGCEHDFETKRSKIDNVPVQIKLELQKLQIANITYYSL